MSNKKHLTLLAIMTLSMNLTNIYAANSSGYASCNYFYGIEIQSIIINFPIEYFCV